MIRPFKHGDPVPPMTKGSTRELAPLPTNHGQKVNDAVNLTDTSMGLTANLDGGNPSKSPTTSTSLRRRSSMPDSLNSRSEATVDEPAFALKRYPVSKRPGGIAKNFVPTIT
jgi:hypothetical protein